MKKVTLYIESGYDSREISLEEETSIGRTSEARIVLEDVGLSRLNTTFFRDGEDILVVDENSTNGTFVNGKKLSSAPQLIFDGDEIKMGNDTRVRVSMREKRPSPVSDVPPPKPKSAVNPPKPAGKTQTPTEEKEKLPIVVVGSIAAILGIVIGAIAG
ncbi:MAG TPA: FHA domain-containing protein [Pyrinomonadaceae bacterium]|nr:FHA domain-containing protein [Pyrinomonadaceae bacterium]